MTPYERMEYIADQRAKGVRLHVIAAEFGISVERVRQLEKRWSKIGGGALQFTELGPLIRERLFADGIFTDALLQQAARTGRLLAVKGLGRDSVTKCLQYLMMKEQDLEPFND